MAQHDTTNQQKSSKGNPQTFGEKAAAAGRGVVEDIKSLDPRKRSTPTPATKAAGIMLGDIDLSSTTWQKGVQGGTRRFYVNFLPGGKMHEVYAEDTTHLVDGSYTVKDGKLVITTKADVDYTSTFSGKPDPFGAITGTEEPGGTKLVLSPVGRKVEF